MSKGRADLCLLYSNDLIKLLWNQTAVDCAFAEEKGMFLSAAFKLWDKSSEEHRHYRRTVKQLEACGGAGAGGAAAVPAITTLLLKTSCSPAHKCLFPDGTRNQASNRMQTVHGAVCYQM